MAKRDNQLPQEKLYVFMCERLGNSSYHVDFDTKEEALEYVANLDDPKISWYGVYKKNLKKDYLETVMSKRIFETVIQNPRKEYTEEDRSLAKKKRTSKQS